MRRTLFTLAGAAALTITLTACGDTGADSDGAAGGCTPASSVTVHAQDALKFDAKSYDAAAGCIEITYTNDGSLAHTLVMKGQRDFKKLSIGDTDKETITLEPGTYTLYCDIPGHEAAGMEAELTVS